MLDIQIDSTEIERLTQTIKLIPGAVKQVQRYALMKAQQVMKTTAITETVAKYYVKAAELRKSITTSRKNGELRLQVWGQRRTIAAYMMTPTRRPKHGRYYLYGAVKREGGLKPLGRDAFLMPSRGKHPYLPMRRLSRERLPIEPVIAPAYPQIVGNEQTIESIRLNTSEALTAEFKRQALRSLGVLK